MATKSNTSDTVTNGDVMIGKLRKFEDILAARINTPKEEPYDLDTLFLIEWILKGKTRERMASISAFLCIMGGMDISYGDRIRTLLSTCMLAGALGKFDIENM